MGFSLSTSLTGPHKASVLAQISVWYSVFRCGWAAEKKIKKSSECVKLLIWHFSAIHDKEDEEPAGAIRTAILPLDKGLTLANLDFQYEGPHSPFVLKDLDLEIPHKKITAIVGTSGSGKTTLIKLLLKFYAMTAGKIKLGETDLAQSSSRVWREHCGVLMQEGYIFSDTIANIREHVESLPLAYNTKIGMDGHGFSTGQRQRLLIARAVYTKRISRTDRESSG